MEIGDDLYAADVIEVKEDHVVLEAEDLEPTLVTRQDPGPQDASNPPEPKTDPAPQQDQEKEQNDLTPGQGQVIKATVQSSPQKQNGNHWCPRCPNRGSSLNAKR